MKAALEAYNRKIASVSSEQMVLNLGPQHPSTHGVLRLELITDGEMVLETIPHLGYLHRCFEKHAEALTYPQIIPYTDRLDYLASMNNNLAFVQGVEKMMGLEALPQRIEYIRVLVCELNRIASHLMAIGAYALDVGAVTPMLWCFRDREHIIQLFEWASGARLLYNYIWVGGLFYDIPVGFEEKCLELLAYLKPKMLELDDLLTNNAIFIQRTANVGVLPLATAIDYGCTGPMLRGSGLKYDLRRMKPYSVYPELEFNIPVGKGLMGTTGDCWDRFWIRNEEINESIHIAEQCIERLLGPLKRSPDFDPRALLPKKCIPKITEYYSCAENPKGELGFYFLADGRTDKPLRCKVRAPSFNNLHAITYLGKNVSIADLIAILGSIDIVLGEVDR